MAIRLLAGASPVFPALGRRAFSCRYLVVVAGLLAACGREQGPAERPRDFVRDDAGRAVPLTPVPQRIVSLSPSATELLVELGAAPRLVGRTSFDHDPTLADVPELGESLSPNVESIFALGPDLVITASDVMTGGLARRLAELGIRVYEVDAQRVEDVLDTARRLSTLIGDAERGEALADRIVHELELLRASLADRPAIPVMYLVWHSPPMIAGGETYLDELVQAAGGRNVFSGAPGWASVSMEEVIAREPEVVVVATAEDHSLRVEWLTESPQWQKLPAVRSGRLISVDSDLFNRPGPRLVVAARTLAAALHPEVFR